MRTIHIKDLAEVAANHMQPVLKQLIAAYTPELYAALAKENWHWFTGKELTYNSVFLDTIEYSNAFSYFPKFL